MALTTLQAINDILTSVDLPTTNDVNDSSDEVKIIRNIIDQQNKFVQSKGYFFNTQKQTFQPTIDNVIPLPNDVLKTDSTLYAIRDQKLWDLTENTFTITEEVTLDVVVLLDMSHLPFECAYLVACKARTLAQIKIMPDPNETQINVMQEKQAKRQFNEYVLESYNSNFIRNVSDIWQR